MTHDALRLNPYSDHGEREPMQIPSSVPIAVILMFAATVAHGAGCDRISATEASNRVCQTLVVGAR